MRDLVCYICGTPLAGRLDTFGPVGGELCESCNSEFERQMDEDCRIEEMGRIPCPKCGKPMTESAEPGLWHCWDCHLWVDKIRYEAWTFGKDPSTHDPTSGSDLFSRVIALASRLALEVKKAR